MDLTSKKAFTIVNNIFLEGEILKKQNNTWIYRGKTRKIPNFPNENGVFSNRKTGIFTITPACKQKTRSGYSGSLYSIIYIMLHFSGRLFIKAHHPLYTIFIFQHTEVRSPKGFIHWHGLFSVCR